MQVGAYSVLRTMWNTWKVFLKGRCPGEFALMSEAESWCHAHEVPMASEYVIPRP